MAERVALIRQISEKAAKQRLQRLGATACEPAWVSLWAAALGLPDGNPGAWLLSAQEMHRALLVVGAELPTQTTAINTELSIDSGLPPTPEALKRLWLWERIATPRHWRIQLLDREPTSIWLPCWLGYARGRQHRLLVISGLSGEPLPMLKPIVLKGLQLAHQEEQNTASSEQQVRSISRGLSIVSAYKSPK